MSKPYYVKFEVPKDLVSAIYEAPPEVVAHLPIICEERNAPYVFVPSKQQLGEAMGISVGSAAASIIDAGESQHILDEIVNSTKNRNTKSPSE